MGVAHDVPEVLLQPGFSSSSGEYKCIGKLEFTASPSVVNLIFSAFCGGLNLDGFPYTSAAYTAITSNARSGYAIPPLVLIPSLELAAKIRVLCLLARSM